MVGGDDFGTVGQFSTATGRLILTGAVEDGWAGIDFSVNNYAYRVGNFARTILLVTDEDRDNTNGSLSFASVLTSLNDTTLNGVNTLLNAVVNCSFRDGTNQVALGIDSSNNAYIANGAGGFTKTAGGVQAGVPWCSSECRS